MEQALRSVLGKMLELAGEEIGEDSEGPVTTGPLEPLQGEPPAVWIRGAAFHSAEVHRNSLSIPEYLQRMDPMATRVRAGEEEDDIPSTLWGAVEDLRFHVFAFPLYSDMIRERLLLSHMMNGGLSLLPSQETEIRVLPITAGMDRDTGEERAARILGALGAICVRSQKIIEEFAKGEKADLQTLGVTFANLQRTLLELALILIHADVLLDVLMRDSGGQ